MPAAVWPAAVHSPCGVLPAKFVNAKGGSACDHAGDDDRRDRQPAAARLFHLVGAAIDRKRFQQLALVTRHRSFPSGCALQHPARQHRSRWHPRSRPACMSRHGMAGAHVVASGAHVPLSNLSNPRGKPGGSRIEDVRSRYLKPNSDGGKSCNQQACAPDLTFVDRNIVDLFCGQTLSRLRHIRLKMTQAPRPGSHCASGRPRRPMPGSFNAGRRMSRPTTPPKRLSSIPSIHPIVSPR